MKQMPVESFFAQVGIPSRCAIARTSRFADLAQREHDRRQLRLRKLVQEIALVLGRVDGLEQFARASARAPQARVVAGGDPVGAQMRVA